jgi:hypothetical protein
MALGERGGIKNTHNFFWGPEFVRHNRHESIRQCPCIISLSYFSDKKCHCSHSRPLEIAFPYCITLARRHATLGATVGPSIDNQESRRIRIILRLPILQRVNYRN